MATRQPQSRNIVRRHKRDAYERGDGTAVQGTIVNPDGPTTTQANGGATHQQASAAATAGVQQLADTRTPAERYREAATLRAVGGDTRWRAIAATHDWAADVRAAADTPPTRENLAAAFRELEGLDRNIAALRKTASSIGREEAEALQTEIEKLAQTYTALTPAGIRVGEPRRSETLAQLTDEQVHAAHNATRHLAGQIEHVAQVASDQLTTDDDNPRRKRRGRRGGGGYGGGGRMGGGGMFGGRGNQQQQNQNGGLNIVWETLKRAFTGR